MKKIGLSNSFKTTVEIATMHILGDKVALGNLEGQVSIVQLDPRPEYSKKERNAQLPTSLHQSVIYDMKVLDPTKNSVVSCSMDKSIKIWSEDFALSTTLTQGQEKIKYIAVDNSKPDVLGTGCKFGMVKIWDLNKGVVESSHNLSYGNQVSAVEGLDFRHGSNVLAITCNRGDLKLVDRRNMKKSIFSVALSNSGKIACGKLQT